MTELDDAIDLRLSSDVFITDRLARFGGGPAIFVSTPLPTGVTLPYITVPPIVAQEVHDAKREAGRALMRDIEVFTAANGDPATVDALAERVFDLFQKNPLTVEGWSNSIISAKGPAIAPTDKTLYGRMITIEVILWKQ